MGNDSIDSMENKSDEKYVFCSQCGEQNLLENNFCKVCGNNLKVSKQNRTYEDKHSDNDIKTFISTNSDYYLIKFKDIKQLQNGISWNWASFFLSTFWFIYRKMYALGLGVLVCFFVIEFIPNFLVQLILNLGITILCGMFGNSIYLNYVEKEIGNVENITSIEKQRILQQKGGTNVLLPILLAIALSFIWIVKIVLVIIQTFYYYGMYY